MNTITQEIKTHVQEELSKVMSGLNPVIDIITIGIIAGGHLLIQGAPGCGKTLLSKSLIQLLGQKSTRIDCGNDIEFTNILHSLSGDIMHPPKASDKTLLYLVGLNRLTPNTQAILLPVMEEHQLINNGQVVTLAPDFRIIATYDPECYEDTYPLISALRDRFYTSLTLSYLTPQQEINVLKTYDYPLEGHKENLDQILTPLQAESIAQARAESKSVLVTDPLYEYVTNITHALRQHPDVQSGVSQRGSLSIINAAKIRARLCDRDYVNPDDIKSVTPCCLIHRMRLTSDAMINNHQSIDIINEALTATELPNYASDQN
jgi:MoxR-like ATPase